VGGCGQPPRAPHRWRSDWHSITLWGKTAEAARDIKAGDIIAINGSLRHRTIGDDGQERKLSAIDCRQFQLLERARDRSQDLSPGSAKEPSGPSIDDAGQKSRTRTRARGKGVERGRGRLRDSWHSG
jgi:single-stranded DNA-binding protein